MIWFKRKTYGWGWTPATWQGWLAIAVYVVLLIVFSLTLNNETTAQDVAFTFILPVAILTGTLITIAYKKGEAPRWQWGKEK
jgi:K+-sensing histidine kinase KdpD